MNKKQKKCSPRTDHAEEVRRLLYQLIVGDSGRRQRIKDDAILGLVKAEIDKWNSKDPALSAYTDEQPHVMEFLPELIGAECEGQIGAFCAEELGRLGIRDANLEAELVTAWLATAVQIIQGDEASPYSGMPYGFGRFGMLHIKTVDLQYKFPYSLESYGAAQSDIDLWLSQVARPALMSHIEFLKPVPGPLRKLEKQIHALFLRHYNEDRSERSVAIEVFGSVTKRKNVADGIKHIQSLFAESAIESAQSGM